MKNKPNSRGNTQDKPTNTIPDLVVINLETGSVESNAASTEDNNPQDGANPSGINLHVVFLIIILVLFLVLVFGLIYSFLNWGRLVDLDDFFKDGPGEIDNKLDLILPAIDKDNNPIYKNYGEGANILFFGNAPFADDRDSEDNLVNMIQQMTGANVYNLSVADSYLAAQTSLLDPVNYPSDIFNFYWLCHIAVSDMMDEVWLAGLDALGDSAPPQSKYIYDTLNSLDFNTVDAIVVMYDASDYLAGHEMYNDADDIDIVQFTGNLEAGIEIVHEMYPHIRFIVLSPPYAFAIDENGEYISSDIQRYGWDVLSTYVIKQYQSCSSRSVTFIDNLYGTITEDNASEYLIDNLHLNVEGRKLIAQRFVEALNYYADSANRAK